MTTRAPLSTMPWEAEPPAPLIPGPVELVEPVTPASTSLCRYGRCHRSRAVHGDLRCDQIDGIEERIAYYSRPGWRRVGRRKPRGWRSA